MKNLFTFLFLGSMLAFSIESAAWREVGNGGDYVRSQFLRMGEVVIKYLNETQEGQDLVKASTLDVAVLIQTLDVTKVKVVEMELIDNTSSIVDAIGVPGMILLNHDKWLSHFSQDREVYYLVFHEMLRSGAVNDDNFIISKLLIPFPTQRKIKTSLTNLYPLVLGSVKDYIQGQIKFAGQGCLSNLDDHFIDFDSEWNILTLSLDNFILRADDQRPTARKACSLTIPISLPAQYQIEVTQAEFSTKFEANGNGIIKTQLEIFNAGSTGLVIPQILNVTGIQKGRLLGRTASVYKSECGFNGNLRLNSSVQLSQQTGSIDASADRIKLYFNLIPCGI